LQPKKTVKSPQWLWGSATNPTFERNSKRTPCGSETGTEVMFCWAIPRWLNQGQSARHWFDRLSSARLVKLMTSAREPMTSTEFGLTGRVWLR